MTTNQIARNLLYEEIASDNINILRVRELCRDNPGLVASGGLRIRVWSILLLGESGAVGEDVGLMNPQEPCGEMHVLEADVKRTRAGMDSFRSSSWRRGLTDILQIFCLSHNIQYKQGMNEVAAPFLYLNPPPHGEALSFVLFEAFVCRYLENFFCKDDSAYLFKAFRMFHLLLVYVDPQLAQHLQEQQFVPELYSPQWFLTLYSRGLDLHLVLRLWDMMIAVDDPAFTFFVGLALLREKRERLLLADSSDIPEIISDMHIRGEDGVDGLVLLALELYRKIPRCFLRYLRVCCVHTPELAPLPTPRKRSYSGGALVPDGMAALRAGEEARTEYTSRRTDDDCDAYSQAMACQSVRKCMMLSPSEFISAALPISTAETGNSSEEPGDVGSSAISFRGQSQEHTQMVVIDIRSSEEVDVSGGGSLPTSLQMEPDFLDQPDALEKWLDHFDSMRGLPICIVDMPPSQASSGALWKRLLLGQGDGISPNSVQYGETALQSRLFGGFLSNAFTKPPCDDRSPFQKAEMAAIADDSSRAAVRLAVMLQKHNFSRVVVLDGGFPALVSQLFQSRGKVEPVIINHDHDKWSNFIVISGRSHCSSDLQAAREAQILKRSKKYPMNSSFKMSHDLSEMESTNIALEVATRLGHNHMRKILEDKMKSIQHR